jgi:hypothetical protein
VIPGFNHNLRYKGVLFHVQTEDGGLQSPYVVTTIFHEGNVVAQRRRSYEKFAQLPERGEIVLAMMKEQHKDLMKDLVNSRLRSAAAVVAREPGRPAAPPPAVPPPPAPAGRTLDVDKGAEKTLDELILEFLSEEQKSRP